ncbi:hypothetical protein E4T42_09104 [Aureobasidium subglaciale]|nr:hypothetical protein E4T42_09104 [Aureobasidium subglaciale]
MPLSDHDKALVEAMFRDNCDVNTVLEVVPHAARSTLYWMQRNFEAAGHVQKPPTAIKQRGRRRKLTPIVRQYAMELLAHRNDLWQEELAFELWCEFDIEVSNSTICRMLKEERLTSKVNTRIASRRSAVKQGVYEETLAQLMARGREAGIVVASKRAISRKEIIELCGQFGVQLLYLPPYSPHLNPIEHTFHLLKHWLRKHRDLAPRVDEFDEPEAYKAAWIEHLEKATAWALDDVSISNLFVRSRVSTI